MDEEKNEDIWFLDSGCSNHMTGNIAMISMLYENVKSQVTLGIENKVSIMGNIEMFPVIWLLHPESRNHISSFFSSAILHAKNIFS